MKEFSGMKLLSKNNNRMGDMNQSSTALTMILYTPTRHTGTWKLGFNSHKSSQIITTLTSDPKSNVSILKNSGTHSDLSTSYHSSIWIRRSITMDNIGIRLRGYCLIWSATHCKKPCLFYGNHTHAIEP